MDDNERLTEKAFSNGDIYVGNFKGVLPHGKGKYTWSDGTFYEGDWEEGKMTGKGHIVWPLGSKYEGDFSGSYLHGFGIFTGPDGSVYRGIWRMNIRHGLGRKEYSNKDVYNGAWKEGVHEGSGRYSWINGNTYIGNWKGGKMCGRGVMKWVNGDIFDGSWLNGYRHGSGFYRFADGGYYFGTWSHGLKDGKGKFYPSGSKHPSLRRFCSTLKCDDDDDDDDTTSVFSHSSSINTESRTQKPSVKRSLSEKISGSGPFRSSGRTSLRTSSFGHNRNLQDPAGERKSEVQDGSTVVFEREYMQGVLIKEEVRDYAKLPPKGKQRSKFSVKEVKRSSCVDIFEGNRSYYLMLNLQLGIRYTVGKITPVPVRDVRASDFGERARIRMYFPRKGSQFTPPHHSIDFHWKDYCPMVFRNLREMFKLDAAEYMMSMCGDNGLREISSPGKSGSLFYLSHDDRFVIKTLKKYELKVLLKMLPKYYSHVGEYENTLITKFFGLHRITLKCERKVRFVVMGNMFCTELRIHRSYDLKGSTVGRFTEKDKMKENTTLKDQDLSYVFHMDKLLRESLFRQISIDCMFLESQEIIDYSLLLGLHFRAPEHLKALLEPPNTTSNPESFPADDGTNFFHVQGISSQGELNIPPKALLLVTHEPSFVGTAPGPHIRGNTLRAYSVGDKEVDLLLPGTGRLRVQLGVNMPAQANRRILETTDMESMEVELFEVYDVVLYMGIIDILQEYNMKKKLEHAYKSRHNKPMEISVCEPKLYASRFINFLGTVFPEEP